MEETPKNIILKFDIENRVITYSIDGDDETLLDLASRGLVSSMVLMMMSTQGWNTIMVPLHEGEPVVFSGKHAIVAGEIICECGDDDHHND